jgi:hypothetical protein
MNNFRSISILPAISKEIESVVFEHLHHYLLENNLLSQKQFRFRENHSTTDCLLSIQKTTINKDAQTTSRHGEANSENFQNSRGVKFCL